MHFKTSKKNIVIPPKTLDWSWTPEAPLNGLYTPTIKTPTFTPCFSRPSPPHFRRLSSWNVQVHFVPHFTIYIYIFIILSIQDRIRPFRGLCVFTAFFVSVFRLLYFFSVKTLIICFYAFIKNKTKKVHQDSLFAHSCVFLFFCLFVWVIHTLKHFLLTFVPICCMQKLLCDWIIKKDVFSGVILVSFIKRNPREQKHQNFWKFLEFK